jgi:hypothetical protein
VGKVVTRLRKDDNPDDVDLEKAAMLISIDNLLKLRKAAAPLLPRPAEALLAAVHRLVSMKREALLTGKSARFTETLEEMKDSPSRILRAVAAAAGELFND